MATEIIEIDAAWAEKWTKTIVQFLLAPTVDQGAFAASSFSSGLLLSIE